MNRIREQCTCKACIRMTRDKYDQSRPPDRRDRIDCALLGAVGLSMPADLRRAQVTNGRAIVTIGDFIGWSQWYWSCKLHFYNARDKQRDKKNRQYTTLFFSTRGPPAPKRRGAGPKDAPSVFGSERTTRGYTCQSTWFTGGPCLFCASISIALRRYESGLHARSCRSRVGYP